MGLDSAALAIAARTRKAQQAGGVLTNPRGLRRFRARLGNALGAPVHISCHGDSITQGVGTENSNGVANNQIADVQGWPGQLRALFAARYGTLGGGAITPFFSGTDSRVALTGGPTADLTIGPCNWGARIRTDRSIQVTTPACTAIDILYYAGGIADGSLIGGFSYQIDGGAVTSGLPAGQNSTPGYKVLTISGLSNTAHTINLVGLHATNLQHITAIRYHNNQGVVVSRWGRAGWTLLDYLGIGEMSRNNSAVSDAYVRSRIAAQFGAWGESLTIVSLGQNDASLQQTPMGGGTGGGAIGTVYPTVDVYESYLRAIVATVAANGGCTLLLNTALPPAGGVTVPGGGQPFYAYHLAARRIANDTDHVAHLSIADRWGTTGDTTSAENVSLGMLSAPMSVHPSRQGYGDIASGLMQTLLRPDLTA
ncbi:MAG: hypothetical protein DI606_04485 [Sphingobium sp.]|uniref:hypothetical protein n=1 Tax=Sphingobium sp. TaxID=1912891 RepID=UPI000DB37FEC|nr:hypothetical protein [Sphingobium sp.]PZU13829.1 MAG: hypothetical protein DI606_04485 [Sphingobium sp.]